MGMGLWQGWAPVWGGASPEPFFRPLGAPRRANGLPSPTAMRTRLLLLILLTSFLLVGCQLTLVAFVVPTTAPTG